MPVAGRDETFTAFFSEVAARSVRAAAAPIRNSRLVGDMLSFCLNPKPVVTVDSPPLADVLRSPIDFDKLPRETPAAIRNLNALYRECAGASPLHCSSPMSRRRTPDTTEMNYRQCSGNCFSRNEAVGFDAKRRGMGFALRVDQCPSACRAFPIGDVDSARCRHRRRRGAEVVSEYTARFRIHLLDAVLDDREKSRQAPMSFRHHAGYT